MRIIPLICLLSVTSRKVLNDIITTECTIMLIWGNHMSENSDNMKLITEDQIKEITPEEAAQELAPAAEAKAPAKPAKASKKKACDTPVKKIWATSSKTRTR